MESCRCSSHLWTPHDAHRTCLGDGSIADLFLRASERKKKHGVDEIDAAGQDPRFDSKQLNTRESKDTAFKIREQRHQHRQKAIDAGIDD
jgi:hypothetical protein